MPTKLEHSDPDGNPLQQNVMVVIDAIRDPATRDALDNLSQRLAGNTGGDSS